MPSVELRAADDQLRALEQRLSETLSRQIAGELPRDELLELGRHNPLHERLEPASYRVPIAYMRAALEAAPLSV